MSQRQHHRGMHPEDANLFAERWVGVLRGACGDLSYLLSKGYTEKSALKLVGDRYQLAARQREAVRRASCADSSLSCREGHQVAVDGLSGARVAIDGYNLLIGIESALSGGVLIRCRDGCLRDIASVHGSYRTVNETLPALRLIGCVLAQFGVLEACWWLDAPVSNSGRLKGIILKEGERAGWAWRAELAANPDVVLRDSQEIVITTDGGVLDHVSKWANAVEAIVGEIIPAPSVLDIRP